MLACKSMTLEPHIILYYHTKKSNIYNKLSIHIDKDIEFRYNLLYVIRNTYYI